jgi:hypothetical protein
MKFPEESGVRTFGLLCSGVAGRFKARHNNLFAPSLTVKKRYEVLGGTDIHT